MNWDQVQENWKELAGPVTARWRQLTSDDLNVISGFREELIGRIQQRYGIARDEARLQVDQWSAALPDDPATPCSSAAAMHQKAS